MADEFDLNIPPVEEESVEQPVNEEALFAAELSEEYRPPVRPKRRRRKQRPKWQRLLWRYWPPIRFGLIILAGILMIWLVGSALFNLFKGPETPPDTNPSTNQTEPSDTTPSTEPTEPTPPPTTEPTEPIVVDPFADAVDPSWFDNALMIGDFTYAGLGDSARLGNETYFTTGGLGVFNYDSEVSSDVSYDDLTLDALLTANNYDKILVNVGINNCGYPTSSLISAYEELVEYLKVSQPGATIILQAILPVTENYANGRDYFSAASIAQVNEQIAALADGETVFYINVNENFTDAEGYLNANISIDGCHMYSGAYADMAKWISVAVGRLGIE